MEPSEAESVKQWLEQFQNQWYRLRKCEYLSQALQKRYNTVENPFVDVLQIIQMCDDFMQVKQKSLCFTVVEELGKWIENKKEEEVLKLLTNDVQVEALNVAVKQRNIALIRLVVVTYKIQTAKHNCIGIIKEMILSKHYKEACQVAAALQLHEAFDIMDFLIPLIFQDKLTVAEEFLSGSVHHQKELVVYLDSLLGTENIRDFISAIVTEYQIPDVKTGKLYYKPLSKLITRLIETYQISHNICPHLSRKRSEGALQFLLRKRYHDQSLGVESWREMVIEACGFNQSYQRELISMVAPIDPEEGLFWVQKFGIPMHEWPRGLADREHSKKTTMEETSEENWDSERIEFHKFSLPKDKIIVVDTTDKFVRFIEEVASVELLGMDCEWKPSFGLGKSDLSLLQVATKTTVYIIDVIVLGVLNESLWQEVNTLIFGNPKIMKLGFGMSSDMNILSQSLPLVFDKHCEFLDVAELWKSLKDLGFVFPYTYKGIMGESLSNLVYLCLGKPIDKSDQFSNWERRPLRDSQLVYAALDAYCLIEIFEVMKEGSVKQVIPFNDICAELTAKKEKSPKKGKSRKKTKPRRQIMEAVCPFTNSIPAASFRVLCDVGLKGLGQELRKVGIDTIIPESDCLPDHFVRRASAEQRVILTQHASAVKYSQYVPSGYCYPVSSEGKQEQLREVLSHFKVVVRREDVFSRCKKCNGASFNQISQATLKVLREPDFLPVPKVDDDELYADDCGGFLSDADDDVDEPGPPVYASSQSNQLPDRWVENINLTSHRTRFGAIIDTFSVPQDCIEKHSEFYICEVCGKIYWDGSHFDRYINTSLKGILED